MGKYIRHTLAALVGLLFGALFGWLKTQFGWVVPEDQVQTLVDAVVALLEPAVMVLFYALTEKFLKRFPSIDLEGFIDRLWLKKEAAVSERNGLL